MFQNVADEEVLHELRMRLVKAKTCVGIETDDASMKLVAFDDADGMECEIAIWKQRTQRRIAFFLSVFAHNTSIGRSATQF